MKLFGGRVQTMIKMSLILPIILKNLLKQILIKEEWIPDQYMTISCNFPWASIYASIKGGGNFITSLSQFYRRLSKG